MQSIKKLLIYILAPIILLLALGVATYYVINHDTPNVLNFGFSGTNFLDKNKIKGNLENQNNIANDDKIDITNYFNNNDFKSANQVLDEALAKNPAEVYLLVQKALTLAQEGSLTFKEKELGDKAREYLLQVLRLDPQNVSALTLLGYTYEIQEDYVNSHKYYDQALNIDPNSVETLSQKAHAYLLEGKKSDAKKNYQKVIVLDKNNYKANFGLAKILVSEGNLSAAKKTFVTLAEQTQNVREKAENYYSAAVLSEAIKPVNIDEIESLSALALAADPNYPLALVEQAKVLFMKSFLTKDSQERKNLIGKSFSSLAQALKLNPNQSLALMQLFTQFKILGQNKQADLISKNIPTIIDKDITLSAVEKKKLKSIFQPAIIKK